MKITLYVHVHRLYISYFLNYPLSGLCAKLAQGEYVPLNGLLLLSSIVLAPLPCYNQSRHHVDFSDCRWLLNALERKKTLSGNDINHER